VEGNRYVLGTPRTTALAANQGTAGSPGVPITQEQADQLLLASITGGQGVDLSFVYDASGKRDPFQPFDLAPKGSADESRSPLERVSFSQMKVTAVLGGIEEPTAIVELENGRGYPVKKGTKIGTNGGEVVEIQPNKVVILETIVDFTGEKKTNTVELVLRSKSNNDR
jgi:type IV pilus assembly protein PilP